MHSSHAKPLAITPLDHSLMAASVAESLGMGADLVVAALLHDCGHLLPAASSNTSDNESMGPHVAGSLWLRHLGFSDHVCNLVASHFDAKRFMCYEEESYHASLSDTAKDNLFQHGGPMSRDEAVAFRSRASFETSMALRHCCEEASSPKSSAHAPRRSPLRRFQGFVEDHLGDQLADQCWWEDLGELGTYHEKR